MLIGIAGGSGSGKTTISNELCKRLGACVQISHDDYYKPLGHLTEQDRAEINFDHPDALDTLLLVQHLQTLRNGLPITVPEYCFKTHNRKPSNRHVATGHFDFVLVDGVLLFHDQALVNLFDIRIFVDASEAVCFERRKNRDQQERGRSLASIASQWEETVKPMFDQFVAPSIKHADHIINSECQRTAAAQIDRIVQML